MPTTRAPCHSGRRSTAQVEKRPTPPPRPRRRPRPHRHDHARRSRSSVRARRGASRRLRPRLHVKQRTETPVAHTSTRPPASFPLAARAILGSIALSMAIVASAHAEAVAIEGSPNDLNCSGHISAGTPELGSEELQVRYTFYCNGPITGYQLETNMPVNGFEASPLVTNTQEPSRSRTRSPAAVKYRAGRTTARARQRPAGRRSPDSSRSSNRCARRHAWTPC